MPFKIAPFDSWTYEDAYRELKAILPEGYHVRADYAVAHDHFRKGEEWVGPGQAAVNDTIKKQFAPEDAVGEVLSNVSNAFEEPQIGCVPLKENDPAARVPESVARKIKDAKNLLTQWWDDRALQDIILNRQETAAWAGRAGLRLWIPARFLEEQQKENGETVLTIRETSDMAEALSFIHVDNPMPEFAGIVTDPATQDKCAIYLSEDIYYDSDNQKKTYKKAELIYLDPARTDDDKAETIIRVVYSNKEKVGFRTTLELSGSMLFSEMKAKVLLTDPVLRTQRQLNLVTTLITRITETAAFRERYTLNAKPQGTRIPYTEGDELASGAFLERDDEGRLWQVVPTARTLGANTTTELVGLPKYDKATGDQMGNETPGVTIVDPVDPKPYLEASDYVRRRILRMCGQGHLGGISNAEASGIAYEQARAVFEKDLNRRRISEEGMLRELLTAVLRLAEAITNKDGFYTGELRITVDQHVNPGPRSPDLVRLDLESYEAGVLSRETTMARIGVEDIEAELMRVRKSSQFIVDVLERVTAASTVFDTDSLIAMMKELGLPEEIVSLLKKQEEAPEPVNPQEGDLE